MALRFKNTTEVLKRRKNSCKKQPLFVNWFFQLESRGSMIELVLKSPLP